MSSIEYINSVVLNASAASVDFTSIPQHYQDIFISCSPRTDQAAVVSGMGIRLNNVSTTGVYSVTRLDGNGSSASSGRDSASSETQSNGGVAPGNSATASVYGTTICNILSYSSTSFFKNVLWESGDGGQSIIRSSVTLFQSLNAITSVSLRPGSGNFVSGSTFTLWGVR